MTGQGHFHDLGCGIYFTHSILTDNSSVVSPCDITLNLVLLLVILFSSYINVYDQCLF